MLPDKSRVRATHKMLLKHKIRDGAREMNIVPGLHSTLVSVPKMVDEDYIVVFVKSQLKLTMIQQQQYQHQKSPSSRPPDAPQPASGSCHSRQMETKKMTATITAILRETQPAIKRFNDIFVHVEDLAKSIHSDQTGAFP